MRKLRDGLGCCLLIAAVLMTGCKRETAPQPTALDALTKTFEKDRAAALVTYGVVTVRDPKQTLVSTDCMVFEQAAVVMPGSLGQWSAWADAMHYRTILGCGADNLSTLTRAEEARRGLLVMWNRALNDLPYALQASARSGKMGGVIQASIARSPNEGSACQAEEAKRARDQNKGTVSIKTLATKCGAKDPFKLEQSCREAWTVVAAHQGARGPRDEASYLTELLSRYRMAYDVCSPMAAQEYVQFHSGVPRTLFDGSAYRFRVAVDPILACSMQKITDLRQKKHNASPQREYIDCSALLGYQDMYISDTTPNRFTREVFEEGSWLFNPQMANQQPDRWRLGQCETDLVKTMAAQGLNAVAPEALSRHCKNMRRKK